MATSCGIIFQGEGNERMCIRQHWDGGDVAQALRELVTERPITRGIRVGEEFKCTNGFYNLPMVYIATNMMGYNGKMDMMMPEAGQLYLCCEEEATMMCDFFVEVHYDGDQIRS